MKRTNRTLVIAATVISLAALGTPRSQAGHHGGCVAGAVVSGVVAGSVLTSLLCPPRYVPAPVYSYPTVVTVPAAPVVVTTVARPVVVRPIPPPAVVYAPPVVYPAPVVVRPYPPPLRLGIHFGHHHHHPHW